MVQCELVCRRGIWAILSFSKNTVGPIPHPLGLVSDCWLCQVWKILAGSSSPPAYTLFLTLALSLGIVDLHDSSGVVWGAHSALALAQLRAAGGLLPWGQLLADERMTDDNRYTDAPTFQPMGGQFWGTIRRPLRRRLTIFCFLILPSGITVLKHHLHLNVFRKLCFQGKPN